MTVVPTSIASFLTKAGHEPKEFEGVKGERLRTIKLRGQISQGLLLPIEQVFPEKDSNYYWSMVGEDVTEILGVVKWERPISPQLYGQAKGISQVSYARQTKSVYKILVFNCNTMLIKLLK